MFSICGDMCNNGVQKAAGTVAKGGNKVAAKVGVKRSENMPMLKSIVVHQLGHGTKLDQLQQLADAFEHACPSVADNRSTTTATTTTATATATTATATTATTATTLRSLLPLCKQAYACSSISMQTLVCLTTGLKQKRQSLCRKCCAHTNNRKSFWRLIANCFCQTLPARLSQRF